MGITFEVDRLRFKSDELIGLLNVRCKLPGARTVKDSDSLVCADLNFSSIQACQTRAKLLKERAQTNGNVDWLGLVEELRQKVFDAERDSATDVDLRTVKKPEPDSQ